MIISSVTKITFVGAEITFKVAVFTSSVAKIIFVVVEVTFKVFGAGNKMIDLYVILAMPFISFLVVVIYIIEIPSFYFGNAT